MKRTPHTLSMRRRAQRRPATNPIRSLAGAIALAMIAALLPLGLIAPAQGAIVGQGFTVTPADLAFILKQIKIAEAHAAAGPGPSTDPNNCAALLGSGPNQLESSMLSFGLRTVDGSCNNLEAGQETYGAADQTFPRLTTPVFQDAEDASAFRGSNPSSYSQTNGAVVDSEPRTVSNLIVDQTSTNPAAVAAAKYPVRTQGNEGVLVCSDPDADPATCVPEGQTLDIPNVTTDVGLSPPFNSLFTIFGQFFDHGLDKITNGGNGTVFIPLKADDPLVTHGQDGIANNDDDVPVGTPMILTRGTIKNAPDGVRNSPNTDTPFVDQSQTYTSHSSHQVFLREYVDNANGQPVTTGKFLSSTDGGLANWAQIKDQAALKLGLQLVDADVNNIPMIDADQYGKFIPGPNGLPRYRTETGSLVEGDRTNPVAAPANVVRIGTAFLNDIAHSADPGSLTSPKTADGDSDTGGSLDTVAAGQYDDELLDIHAICGDGRCNENIALQAVHQVFHNEHDRLVGYIQGVLTADTSSSGVLALPEWQSALGADGWNGERLFQAARFVTEMEYQHLVFEEFARKVQPAINPFEPFAFIQTDVDPAITAEFAHAVYRFGHSMLTDTIPRLNAPESVADGAPLHNDIPLFDGFLNPAAYLDGGGGVTLNSQQAAGAIIMGLSDQVGQEIDEFVVDTLRNNLLGLPLDLPAINMARARSEGIPPLNDVRRQIFAATNDGQLKPYADWVDFGQQLKHPESLVNFIAAYGTHPSITGSMEARRSAADQIVNGTSRPGRDGVLGDDPATVIDESLDDVVTCDPGAEAVCGDDPATTAIDESLDDVVTCDPGAEAVCGDDPATVIDESLDDVHPPTDSGDFMFGTSSWANTGGRTTTGVDAIDLWMGGLAERTNLFGGLLGSTFNYVFENQLTDLQNGDRFYYLARTPGMNLRAQLEGNSFAELVMRNTNAHTLKADPFATADCKFELDRITWPAAAGEAITGPGSVHDDPASECNENEQLLRMPDGTIRYRTTNTAMPSGINAQAVYNGKAGTTNDRMWGGWDNDTFWGGEGNDIIEGNDGADIALGGAGNDIITDSAGDDIHKGGPGNDAIDAGPGLDIIMAGEGKDFTNGGANTNETFGGADDDFSIGGQGMDAILGDSGDDWEEGGDQPDLLIGDSSSFFFDDHNLPGHDILIGQGGDDDYDMEGGDDIGVAGPGVEKTAGAAGYDWQIGLADPQAQDMDLAQVFVAGGVVVPGVRDKFNEVEALSGWDLDDTLRGDDVVPTAVGGGGFVGCDALDQAGLDRIAGLDALVPDLGTLVAGVVVPSAPIRAATASHNCLLEGNVWGAGNILLGGGGSDLIEGRGADDIIDGDSYLNVRLSVRDGATELGSTDLMENEAKTGGFGTGTAGMTLQEAVFAGLVDPGNIFIVREILSSSTGTDTALFTGALPEYAITANADGSVTVDHQGGVDGVDTLWNIEMLQFGTATPVPAPVFGARAPAVSVDPAGGGPLTFDDQVLNVASAPLAITVTNTGTADLTVSGASVTGTNAGSFAVNDASCTAAPVVADASCTISVIFTPGTLGAHVAQVTITHNATGNSSSVSVQGNGVSTPPVLLMAGNTEATAITFGTRRIGTVRTQNVTVTNQGPGVLVIDAVQALAGSQFSATRGTCTVPVAVGRSCRLSVSFTPTAPARLARTQLTVVSNAVAADEVLWVTGTGR